MEIKWPIIPTQISEYYESESIEDNEKYKCLKHGIGLIDNFELKGLLTQYSAEFENPTTIVELTKDENQPLFRTDSVSYNWELRKTCQLLRKWSEIGEKSNCTHNCILNENLCHTIDNLHVNLFTSLSQTTNPQNIEDHLKENIQSTNYLSRIQELAGDNKTNIIVRKECGKVFLEYDCPFLGYRETLFPIFVEDKYLVGLMFVGEILIESECVKYANIRDSFFKHSRSKFQFDNSNSIENEIKEIGHFKLPKEKFLTTSEYESKIKLIIERIYHFEKRLVIELERKRVMFIGEKFEKYNRKILQIDSSNDKKLNEFDFFWNRFDEHFKQIAIDFPIELLYIFSHEKFQIKYTKELNLVFSNQRQEYKELPNYNYLINRVDLSVKNEVTSSFINKSLVNGLQIDGIIFNNKTDFITLFPINPNNNTYIVTFIRFRQDWNRDSETKEKNVTFSTFEKAFESFFHIVSLKLTTIHANWNAQINRDTLKIFGHEMAQFFDGIDSINEFYLKCPVSEGFRSGYSEKPKIMKMNKSQIYDISRHFESYLSQIIAINRRSKYLVELPELESTLFWPYENLIFKWYNTNKSQLKKEKKNIVIVDPKITDITRPMIYADLKMLQHVFYNLVTNAIKYSFSGTNIYIDGQINEAKEYVFFVKSYGIGIPEDRDIYSLYIQSEEAKTLGNEGLGIGLYISKQIILAHKGSIDHKMGSRQLSKYNIPLMWELNILSQSIQMENKNDILKEFKDLPSSIKSEVVYCNDEGLSLFHPSEEEIQKEIKRPTFENVFTVIIPQNTQL